MARLFDSVACKDHLAKRSSARTGYLGVMETSSWAECCPGDRRRIDEGVLIRRLIPLRGCGRTRTCSVGAWAWDCGKMTSVSRPNHRRSSSRTVLLSCSQGKGREQRRRSEI